MQWFVPYLGSFTSLVAPKTMLKVKFSPANRIVESFAYIIWNIISYLLSLENYTFGDTNATGIGLSPVESSPRNDKLIGFLLAPKVLLDYLRPMISNPIPSQSHPHIAVKTTSPINLINLPMTTNNYKRLTMTTKTRPKSTQTLPKPNQLILNLSRLQPNQT